MAPIEEICKNYSLTTELKSDAELIEEIYAFQNPYSIKYQMQLYTELCLMLSC